MSKLILRGIENVELSICIPAYNRVDTLKEAIDSVLNLQQNGIIYNCIISEDNSKNHKAIYELITSYNDVRIIYYFNETPLGMAENWNNCLKLAKSKYAALLHDDDYLYDDYLYTVRKIWELDIKFDIMYFAHDVQIYDRIEQNNYTGAKKIYKENQQDKLRRMTSGDYYFGACDTYYVPTCGCLYKREEILKMGGYRKKDGFSADEILGEIISRKKKEYFYNHVVAVYRYTDTNLSQDIRVKRKFVEEGVYHRYEMGDNMLRYKILNKIFGKGFYIVLSGRWYERLVPDKVATNLEKILAKIFNVFRRIYIYGRGFSVCCSKKI